MAPLLYELSLHGAGWRVEQAPDAAAEDGWGHGRELAPPSAVTEGEGEPPEAAAGGAEPLLGAVIAAVRQLDAAALRQLWLRPQPALSPASWLRAARHASGLSGLCYAAESLLAERPEWQLALCTGNELLALWRHEDVWLLSPRDNYAQPVAIWRSPPDAAPHRRRLAWNADDSLLALCASDGSVHVLDARARLVHALPPSAWAHERTPAADEPTTAAAATDTDTDTDTATAAASAIVDVAWREPVGSRGIASELLLLCADGVLRRLRVPSAATAAVRGSQPSCAPPLVLHAQHALVTCLAYDRTSGLLAVGGGGGQLSAQARLVLAKRPPTHEPPPPLAAISLWALSDASPHAALLFSSSSTTARDEAHSAASAPPWFRLLPPPARRACHRVAASVWGRDVPLSLSLAAGGARLAVLTLRGELSVWNTEHLAALAADAASSGAADDDAAAVVADAAGAAAAAEPALGTAAAARPPASAIPDPPLHFCNGRAGSPEQWLGAQWWDDRSLILSSRAGALTISALPALTNLLGERPEHFATLPALSAARAGRFFLLERTLAYAHATAQRQQQRTPPWPAADATVGAAVGGLTADSTPLDAVPSRLQSWRLLSLRQTSPEQLFRRKVRRPPDRSLAAPCSSPLWPSVALRDPPGARTPRAHAPTHPRIHRRRGQATCAACGWRVVAGGAA
jgi:hypothetical protein